MATVTLLYAAESTGSGYNTISGSATFTLSGGETLAIVMIGFSTSDVGAPTDSAGTLVKQTAAYNAFVGSGQTHGGWYTEANAAAGSHTITPPTISGGSDGLIGVLKIDGMPSTLNIRDAVKKQQITSSNTFALTTTGTPQVGDVVVGARWHENSVGSTDTITRPSGWTGLWQYLNGSVNLPTDNSYVILGSSGNFTATWTDVDPAITDTTGALLVLVPNAVGPTINTQPANQFVANGAAATFTVSATTSGGGLSYQWQDNSGGSFADIGGATSASLTVLASLSMNGRLYRVNVTDSNGTTTSSSATLFVRSITAAWPPQQIPLRPPFKRAKSMLWLLDPSNWGGASLNVGKWFADELVPSAGGGPTTVSASPGAWSWSGSTATFPVPQVSVTPGTWTWAGSTQSLTQLINVTPGAWSWAGSTQATTQLINQTTGTWSWAGSTQALTQLLNATPGTWTWAGSTQTTTQLINAAVGAWTWAGSTQTISAGLVEVNATPGSWTWVGSTATFPAGATTIDTTPGTWTWAGSTSTIPTQLSAITGTWTWAGSNATTTQLLNAAPGAFTWAGSTATTSQVFDATPGLWSWTGSVQGIVSQVTIDATPGNWSWAGSQSSVISLDPGNIPAGGSGGYEHEAAIIRYRRALFRRQQEAENAAKAKAEATEAQQRLAAANTKRQREKEARIIEKLRRQEDEARTLEEQLIAEIGLLQNAIFGAEQNAMRAEEEEFALMFALTTLI